MLPSAPTIVVFWLSPGILRWTPDWRAAFQLTPVWTAPVSSSAVTGWPSNRTGNRISGCGLRSKGMFCFAIAFTSRATPWPWEMAAGPERDSLSCSLAACECLSSYAARFKIARVKARQGFRSYEAICRTGVGDEAEALFTDEDWHEGKAGRSSDGKAQARSPAY
jgi:hypothetical protein